MCSKFKGGICYPQSARKSKDLLDKKNTFFLKVATGQIYPGKSHLLDVYFAPQSDGCFEVNLAIKIEHNNQQNMIPLKGCGMRSALLITDCLFKFDPILPYTLNCENIFTIENTSSFPVEFYFSDFDL